MGELVDKARVKNSLRLEHSGDDAFIDTLIDEAEAMMQEYIGTPITPLTFTEYFDGGGSKLFLSHHPVDPSTVAIVDRGPELEDASDDDTTGPDDTSGELTNEDYELYPQIGMIRKTNTVGNFGRDIFFAKGARRWKITYDAALNQHDQWGAWVEELLAASVTDLVVHIYESPDPSRRREQFGGGGSFTINLHDVPPRVISKWDRFTSEF